MKFERDHSRNYAGPESKNNPRANRHGGFVFEHAQHVEKETRTTEVDCKENR